MTLPVPSSVPESAPPATAHGDRVGIAPARLLETCRMVVGVYLALWCTSQLLRDLPGIGTGINALLRWMVPPFARLVLGLPNAYPPVATGSGDTAFNYATSALLGVLAVVLTAIMHVRREAGVAPLRLVWWRDLMRLTLAFVLLGYGMAKVIPSQFGSLDATRLVQPLGEFSPMGLLWAFMGHSTAYQMFGGWCEVIPGLLLLFRRTSAAGALLALPVFVNVVALNLSFDVPVKLHALHYLAMTVALLLPIAPSLRAVLSGDAVAKRPPIPAEPTAADVVRGLVTAFMAFSLLGEVAMHTGFVASRAPQGAGDPSLRGIWEVVGRSGSAPAWRVLSIARGTKVRFDRDSSAWITLTFNPVTHQVTLPADWLPLAGPRRAAASITLEYARRGDTLTLSSLSGTEPMRLVLHYRNPDALPLRQTPFRWIQDYPHNR